MQSLDVKFLRAGLRNVAHWSPVRKAQLIMTLTIPYSVFFAVLCGAILVFEIEEFSAFSARMLGGFSAFNALLALSVIAIGKPLRERNPNGMAYVYLCLQIYAMGITGTIYFIGIFSGFTWLVILGSMVIGTALFGWRPLVPGYVSFIILMVAWTYAAYDQWLPYEPLLEMQKNPDGTLDGFRVVTDFVVLLTVSVSVTIMIGYFLTTRQEREAILEKLSNTDQLTQLYNRRGFYAQFIRELDRAARFKRPLSFALIDVDHFKKINDQYGHLTGDEVLVKLAESLKEAVRAHDVVARFGGEEFALILPEAKLEKAEKVVERCRKRILNTTIEKPQQLTLRITVSVGMLECSQLKDRSIDNILRLADEAMYRAKTGGRDQVVVAS